LTPIHHYYHIYADGAWEEAVREHVSALQDSGLTDEDEFVFHVGFVGSEENVAKVRGYLGERQIEWRLAAWEREGWEQLTLRALACEAHQHEGLACYAHTKGAHTPSRFNAEWRRRMTYYNFVRWKDAVASLQTCDAYGCHWMELEGNWIFGGNFWWTHMRHLPLLPRPTLEDRWRAEEWIGHLKRRIENFKVHDPAPPFPGTIQQRNR
jgi:hypothetical protein